MATRLVELPWLWLTLPLVVSRHTTQILNSSRHNYIERIQLFFTATDVENDKKVPILLSVIGAKTYARLVAPELPQDKSFTDLIAILKRHFEPQPVVIAERFRFHRRDQAPGESVAQYVAEL